MALDARRLRWPGADKDRALTASWHLTRAAERLDELERMETGRRMVEFALGRPAPAPTLLVRASLAMAREHLRIARGYLGAIGFEHGGRLERREPKRL